MTVRELIDELQKLPQDSIVSLCVDRNFGIRELYSVEYRGFGLVYLNDKYWTPYSEEDGGCGLFAAFFIFERRKIMPINDELGKRMKENYEQVPKYRLMRRTPVIIRIDGKAFHSFTKGFNRPFDEVLGNAMTKTLEYLCQNIQGCIFGYKQSDEISLVLQDYKKFNSDAWFDYEIQKMCSIAASMTTMAFNRFFNEEASKFSRENICGCCRENNVSRYLYRTDEAERLAKAYEKARDKGAMFDTRVFNIPKEEVVNCIYWRQVDAARNSVQMVGQANFSHRELQGKSCNAIQDMLHEQKGINWNDYPTEWKRGVCWTRDGGLDYDMPMLKGEDRKYLEKLVWYQEEE